MAKTVEISGDGIKVIDTVTGKSNTLLLRASITVTTAGGFDDLAIPTATATAIPFGSIAAAKVLAGVASVATTLKVNGGSESTYILLGPWMLTNTSGTWTSATLTQSSGATVYDPVLVAG